ncbi:Ppx/GppA phosphatase family protein [Blastochloris tepida]|uniref:Exopolyphosphatase n=1 Tax=Blastochloris tepida TaxID=2233851 RepID=A0A348FZ82_9HYPH|nr:Ppx/GppA phosphatase family protein [Blastochloris tepida]BBF92615.1 exopolyphosphatase [Blastochloris tepida]
MSEEMAPAIHAPGGRGGECPEGRPEGRHWFRRPGGIAQVRPAYAALDLGTNNCRLLIARPTHDGFRVVGAFSRIVRLGEGLSASGRLSEAAMVRAIDALAVCRDRLKAYGVHRMRLIATEACRAAGNAGDFIDRVRDKTGLALEIINRETEARLAAGGCTTLVDTRVDGALLFDIGGGSSEIVWLGPPTSAEAGPPRADIRAWASLPVGVVTLAERHGGHQVDRAVFEAMVAEVADLLRTFPGAEEVRRTPARHLLGTSGTVTTIAGVHLGLPRYDRRMVDGVWLAESDIARVTEMLLTMSWSERAANACIGTDRADLVLAGCAILEAIRRAFPAERLRVADRGLREGILVELMRADAVWRRRRPHERQGHEGGMSGTGAA